ncbi:MAG: glycosyltransferase family 4 protein [Desulfatibacillaceae bacterium]
MRVLLVTYNYPPKVGGMEDLVHRLANGLGEWNQVDVIGPAGRGEDVGPPNVHRPTRPGMAAFAAFALARSLSLVRRRRYDVILCGSFLVAPVARVAGAVSGTPVAAVIHGLDVIHPALYYQAMVRLMLSRFDLLIANSRPTAAQAVARGARPERTIVIPPGIGYAEFAQGPPVPVPEIRKRYGVGEGFLILTAGRLVRRKGVAEMVRHGLPRILARHPGAVYVVAGGNADQAVSHGGDVLSLVEGEARRAGVEDNVRLTGRIPREDLVALYFAADVFVLPVIDMPGDVEGFGIVLLEAGAAGKPVVATRSGGVPDAVEDGVTGILATPGDWDSIARAVSDLLDDPGKRRCLGEAGRERAAQFFDWSRVIGQYATALGNLATRRRP